jgi:hypothetical protein
MMIVGELCVHTSGRTSQSWTGRKAIQVATSLTTQSLLASLPRNGSEVRLWAIRVPRKILQPLAIIAALNTARKVPQ